MMNFEAIAEQLKHVGYVVLEKPLLDTLSSRLSSRCHEGGQVRFRPAKIGRGLANSHDIRMRSDGIRWLDDADSTDHAYLVWVEELRLGLNELLYLGLFDFESHYAIYEIGSGYAKHSDVLKGKSNRILSTVLYLNEDWQINDGGELQLFDPVGETVIATVRPTFGKMIIFLSETFPHQVLMARTQRRSIAGWFRGREGA